MRGSSIFLLMMGLIAGPLFAKETSSTLEELVQNALTHHENIQSARSEIRRAEARVRLAGSVLLPRLDLNGNSTWYENEVSFPISESERLIIQPSNDWNWSADLQQTLFSGLRDWKARDIARLNRDQSLIQARTATNALILEVSAAYLSALVADENVQVAQANLKQISSQLRLSRRLFDVGENTAADLSRWQAEEASARQALIIAEGQSSMRRNHLARLCSLDALGELHAPAAPPLPELSDEELQARALAQRPEIQALKHQLEAAGLMVGVEKGNWFPQLDLHAQYFTQKAEFPTSDWMSVSLSLKVPIYDGGRTGARVAEAREDLRQVELLVQKTRRAIADEVDAALIAYRAALASEEAASDRLKAAEEAHRQVESAYRVGEASATDLLETTASLTDARSSLIISRAQRKYQIIALRHALGLEILPGVSPNPGPSKGEEN